MSIEARQIGPDSSREKPVENLPEAIERVATEEFLEEYRQAQKAGVNLSLRIKAALNYVREDSTRLLVGLGEPPVLMEELEARRDLNGIHFSRLGSGEYTPITNKVRRHLGAMKQDERLRYIAAARAFFAENRWSIIFDIAQIIPYLPRLESGSPTDHVRDDDPSERTIVADPASFTPQELADIDAAVSGMRIVSDASQATEDQLDAEITRVFEGMDKQTEFGAAVESWKKMTNQSKGKKE